MAQAPWGDVLECEPLARLARHRFTLRNLDVSAGFDTADASWTLLAAELGVSPSRLYAARQVHGTTVFHVTDGRSVDAGPSGRPDADILITDNPDLAVAVQVADCVPILLADRRGRAVAAVHAGWRGTSARAAAVAVGSLREVFASEALDLVAAVGPSIGPCCYEVGDEVREAFRAAGHATEDIERWFTAGPSVRPWLDLWQASRDQLEAAGVPPASIHVARLCTATDHRFHSYRRDGEAAGRLVAAISPRTDR